MPLLLLISVSAILILLVVIINYWKKNYVITRINSDSVTISRLGMVETLYLEDIKSITMKTLKNDSIKMIIETKKNTRSFYNIDPKIYSEIVNFSKTNNIIISSENETIIEERMNS